MSPIPSIRCSRPPFPAQACTAQAVEEAKRLGDRFKALMQSGALVPNCLKRLTSMEDHPLSRAATMAYMAFAGANKAAEVGGQGCLSCEMTCVPPFWGCLPPVASIPAVVQCKAAASDAPDRPLRCHSRPNLPRSLRWQPARTFCASRWQPTAAWRR